MTEAELQNVEAELATQDVPSRATVGRLLATIRKGIKSAVKPSLKR